MITMGWKQNQGCIFDTIQGNIVDLEDASKFSNLKGSYNDLKQAQWSWNLRIDEMVKQFDLIKKSKYACIWNKVRESMIIF